MYLKKAQDLVLSFNPQASERTETTAFTIAFIFFLLLSIFCWALKINVEYFYAINSWSAAYVPALLSAHLTDLGNGAIGGTLAIVICYFRPNLFKQMLFTVLITSIFSVILKSGLNLPRPAAVLDRDTFNIIGPALKNKSFPSGHTMTIFAFAGFILLSSKHLAIHLTVILFASIIGLSRIFVGAHWPLDILTGALLGLFSAWLALSLSAKPFTERGNIIAAIILCLGAIAGASCGTSEFRTSDSIMYARYSFAAVSALMLVYYSVALLKNLFKLSKNSSNNA